MESVNLEMDITGIVKDVAAGIAKHLGLTILCLDENTIQVEGIEFQVDRFEDIISSLL